MTRNHAMTAWRREKYLRSQWGKFIATLQRDLSWATTVEVTEEKDGNETFLELYCVDVTLSVQLLLVNGMLYLLLKFWGNLYYTDILKTEWLGKKKGKEKEQRNYCYQEVCIELTTSGIDIRSCFPGTYNTKKNKLRRGRGEAYTSISRNEHFAIEFKEEFTVKKGLTFDVLGKNKLSWQFVGLKINGSNKHFLWPLPLIFVCWVLY